MRFCSKCYLCKSFSEFRKRNDTKVGYFTICKSCKNKSDLNYSRKNPDKKKRNQKKYHDANRVEINEKAKIRRLDNIDSSLKKASEYRENNREHVRNGANAWYHANKDKVFSKLKDKRNTNHLFKMKCCLKKRVQQAFKYKSWRKDSKTIDILGADYETVKKHIERKFDKGMSWDNYGRYTWHIDHIIPLATAKTEDELITLCHYTNLQPLWAADNLAKSDKITPTQMVLTI